MSAGRLGGQSVAIAVESTYGSPDAADHALVDTSGLTFSAVKPTRASSSNEATTATIPLYSEPAVSTSGAGQVPEPEAPYLSSGEPAIRELGDFDMVFKGESAQGVNFASTRLHDLLASSLGVVAKTGGSAVTVTTAVSTTVFEVSGGDIALLNPGDVVAWVNAARLTEYAIVTVVNGGTNQATVRPAFSTVPAIGDTVKLCSVAYPKIGALGATSLAVRYRDRAREVMSTGCRANQIGLAFAGDDRRTLEMSFTLNPAFKSVTAYGAALAAPEPAPVTHRIQLGAFSSRELALDAWRAARERHEQLQGLVAQVVEVPATVNSPTTRVFRLQASVASEARAREVCAALSAARQGCVYVLPGR